MKNTLFPKVDEMIREYLVFRGFLNTFKHFEQDRQNDKFTSAEKIVDTIFSLLHSYDYPGFVEFWKHLNKNYFTKWAQQIAAKSHSFPRSSVYVARTTPPTASVQNTKGLPDLSAFAKNFNNRHSGEQNNTSKSSISSSSSNSRLSNSFDGDQHGLSFSGTDQDLSEKSLSEESASTTSDPMHTKSNSSDSQFSKNPKQKPTTSESTSNPNLPSLSNLQPSENIPTEGTITDQQVAQTIKVEQPNKQQMFVEYNVLANSVLQTAFSLETRLKKYYLVYCVQNSRTDKIVAFFEENGELFANDPDWKDWFMIPFLKNPDTVPQLEPYFKKTWSEMLQISCFNFISTVFMSTPENLPDILKWIDNDAVYSMRKRVEDLTNENNALRKRIDIADDAIRKIHEAESQNTQNQKPQIAGSILPPPAPTNNNSNYNNTNNNPNQLFAPAGDGKSPNQNNEISERFWK